MPDFSLSPTMQTVQQFTLPRYDQLPGLRLYLDQLIEAVTEALLPLLGREKWLTPTMVGNYVKQGVLPRPTGKRYDREHMARLLFVCVAKQVLSMEDIRDLLEVQMEAYSTREAYDYFCTEFEHVLRTVFLGQPLPPDTANAANAQTRVVRAVAFSVAYKLYLVQYLQFLHTEPGAD